MIRPTEIARNIAPLLLLELALPRVLLFPLPLLLPPPVLPLITLLPPDELAASLLSLLADLSCCWLLLRMLLLSQFCRTDVDDGEKICILLDVLLLDLQVEWRGDSALLAVCLPPPGDSPRRGVPLVSRGDGEAVPAELSVRRDARLLSALLSWSEVMAVADDVTNAAKEPGVGMDERRAVVELTVSCPVPGR